MNISEAIKHLNEKKKDFESIREKAEYIEKAELIKKLCLETAEGYCSPTIKTIKEFPVADVQPVKQWVELHDRHPDTEGFYLVCDQYGECEVAEYLPDIKSWFTHKINGEIRYWMPLPEPPKGGDAT